MSNTAIELAKTVLSLEGKTLKKHTCVNCKFLKETGKCGDEYKISLVGVKTGPFTAYLPMRNEDCIHWNGKKEIKKLKRNIIKIN